jgi:hypothetical protein
MEIISNIIPVVIVAILILYPIETKEFVHSILGRLFAIILILFYSSIHIVYGVVVCILFILYYRNTHTEGFEDAKQSFREQNCKNGDLYYKKNTVNLEMAEHVYPELSFESKPCNPCSETCNFSIIEERMTNEEVLLAPKNSNDWFNETWSKLWNIPANPVPVFHTKSEPFSTVL